MTVTKFAPTARRNIVQPYVPASHRNLGTDDFYEYPKHIVPPGKCPRTEFVEVNSPEEEAEERAKWAPPDPPPNAKSIVK